MTHTLFIDESGDFDQSPRWIVSGVLCEGKPASAEKCIRNALNPLPRRFGLSSLSDLHLTEMRQRLGNPQAVRAARDVFSTADKTGIVTAMVVVENDRGRGMKESERTYRLMLLDLLALADAALPDDGSDQRLELIIARRQKQGELMSTRDELLEDVVERIEDAVEAGLAAKGLLERLDARHVRIWEAKDSAGLVLADFVANLCYNRHRQESGQLFSTLEGLDRIRLFEGFGGYAERRALIAERDGDLAAALSRWSTLDSQAETKQRQEKALLRLWRRIMTHGATGPMATLEATLERLWRQHKDPSSHQALTVALDRLESTLLEVPGSPPLVYRLRNLMHLVANQLGDIAMADRLIVSQNGMTQSIAIDPSLFHFILDHQLLQTVTEELRLDFGKAVQLARAHGELVEQYAAVWELLEGDRGREGFRRSRLWSKAQMTLVRTLLLSGHPEHLAEADTLLDTFPITDLQGGDLARFQNYRLWADIRCHRYDSAISRAHDLLERDDGIFSAQFAAKAAADALIADQSHLKAEIQAMLTMLRKRAPSYAGHPGDLIWRDLGVLEQHFGSKKASRECLLRSMEINQTLPSSPANLWNRHVIDVHISELDSTHSCNMALPAPVLALQEIVKGFSSHHGLMRAYRIVSPY